MDRSLKLTDRHAYFSELAAGTGEFDMDPEVLAEALTMAGFEVEEIEDRRTWASGVVLGKVTTANPIPTPID